MLNSGLLGRSLRLFLPISGAITLVLVPMVLLYEQSRRQNLEGRVNALVQASIVRVQVTLQVEKEQLVCTPNTDVASLCKGCKAARRQTPRATQGDEA